MSYKKTIVVGLFLFGLVVLIALSTFYASLGSCPIDSLSCDNGTFCVPRKLVCNFVKDCQDGQDENVWRCGNLYGSKKVIYADALEGKKVYEEFNKTYQFQNINDFWDYCGFNENEIPKGCKCMKVNLIRCRNRSEIPANFPREVGMIHLRGNSITLRSTDTFELYKNLSYLDLAFNHISSIPPKLLYKLKLLRKLFLQHNQIEELPVEIFSNLQSLSWLLLNFNHLRDFDLNVVRDLESLQYLELSYNNLKLRNASFPNLHQLYELFLDFNFIEELGVGLLGNLHNLTLLSVRSNHINVISSPTFSNLGRLQELRLSDNPIHILDSDFFLKLPHLNALYLDNLFIKIDQKLTSNLNVSFLSIDGISLGNIEFSAIKKMENLKHIVYKKFFYCHMISDFHVKVCRPKTDGVSSIKNLLMNPTLRYSAWFMVVMITIGNLMVLMGRFIYRDENRSVSVVIRNLAVSDLIMGCYLGIICVQDYRFRDKFQEISLEWTQSWGCVVAGMLSMISSEVSIFILTFMSVERFLLISDPFGHHRLNTKNVMLCLFIIWSVGISIAILPVILFYSSTKFYGIYNGGTCFPLFIQEKYPSGWQYSAIVFLGINSPLLVVVGTLYTFLLFSIWKTRKQCTGRTFDFFDCEFAVRFFFIVLTDSTCWAPIVTFKFLTFMDFEISSDMYAWLVVLVLPLNAAVNPFLYTFSTPKYRDQIYTTFSKRSFSKKHDSNSNQATGDESHNKIMPLLNNSINGGNISTPLRWLFTRKKS